MDNKLWVSACLFKKLFSQTFFDNGKFFLDIRNTQERFTPSKTALNALKSSTNVFFNEQTQKRVVLAIKADIAPYFEKRDYFPRQKIITKAKDGSITLETTISQDEEVLLPLLFLSP